MNERIAGDTGSQGSRLGWGRTTGVMLLVLLVTSCFYMKSEGDAVKREVDELKQKLSGDLAKAETERVKLQKIMEQATALLTRNSADVGAQVERIQSKVDKLSGQMDLVEATVRELQQRTAEFQAKVDVKLEGLQTGGGTAKAPPVPENKDELFQQAQNKISAGDHQEGRRLLRHFIERNPSDTRIDRAQLVLGDSYFSEQKFAQAIVEYKKIVEQFKQSSIVPDALYKIGMAFYQLKFCTDADLFLSQLIKRHKTHAQASRAEKVLQLIKRYKRDPKFCR
jgi:TolA-binding protein